MITLNSTIKGGQTMKKIISLILAAVMLLALGVSALATEILPDSSVAIKTDFIRTVHFALISGDGAFDNFDFIVNKI